MEKEDNAMLTKYLEPGIKVELKKRSGLKKGAEQKHYMSRISDIISEERIELYMPIENKKLIILSVGDEYELVFLGKKSLFICDVKIIDRYKSNNIYFLLVEIVSGLRRQQRREYYRYNCMVDIQTRQLVEEEVIAAEKKEYMILPDELPMIHSTGVDISGGGMRFVTKRVHYEKGSYVYCKYELLIKGHVKEYDLVALVQSVQELVNHRGTFEHRIEYLSISPTEREEIIRYIFAEERKNRKKETKQ